MNPHIIIIAGYPAAGKSTFARRLSSALGIPYLIKDTLKSAICTSVVISNREESLQFSAVTFDTMMYVTERLVETGYPLIIEGNFVPYGIKKIDEAGVIKEMIDKHQCRSLTYKFTGDTGILHKRFLERDLLPERGAANRMFTEPTYTEFDTTCHNLDAFTVGGEVVEIDTTDFATVDFERHIERARDFLNSK